MEKYLEEYKKQGIKKETLNSINKELRISVKRLTSLARNCRIEALNEALNWEKGINQENRKIENLYRIGEYIIAIGKPGKEAAPEYRGCRYYTGDRKGEKTNNPNDMNLVILKSGKKLDKDLTFGDMFEMIEHLMHSNLFGLEIMGMLLYRAAFMVDHKKNKEGNWRYCPPKRTIKELEIRIPTVSEIPIKVFLHFLEVLSLNEDIKVYTLGYNDLKYDYGRINTLLTFTHLIAVFLNRRSLARFSGSFARPPSGMAPIPKTKITEYFPLLSENWVENQQSLRK